MGEYNMKTGLPIDSTGWLFKGWVDGHPALGWQATLAYLSLPVILACFVNLNAAMLWSVSLCLTATGCGGASRRAGGKTVQSPRQ